MRPKTSLSCASRDSQPRLSNEEEELPGDENQLFEVLYPELERQAAWQLRRMPRSHNLQPAALVHEAYIKLRRARTLTWRNRAHFFAIAVKAMREVLTDRLRRRLAGKRDCDFILGMAQQTLPTSIIGQTGTWQLGIEAVLDLDTALARLECDFPEVAEVVILRFFGGFTMDEIAAISDTSRRTIERRWHFARHWLHSRMRVHHP